MFVVAILLSFSGLVFTTGANASNEGASKLSEEAQLCYTTIVSTLEPIQQLVHKCQENYPDRENGVRFQDQPFFTCVRQGLSPVNEQGERNEMAPILDEISKNCGAEELLSNSAELQELENNILDFYDENGLDMRPFFGI